MDGDARPVEQALSSGDIGELFKVWEEAALFKERCAVWAPPPQLSLTESSCVEKLAGAPAESRTCEVTAGIVYPAYVLDFVGAAAAAVGVLDSASGPSHVQTVQSNGQCNTTIYGCMTATKAPFVMASVMGRPEILHSGTRRFRPVVLVPHRTNSRVSPKGTWSESAAV